MTSSTPIRPAGTDRKANGEIVLAKANSAEDVMTRLTGVDPDLPYDLLYEIDCDGEKRAVMGEPLAQAYCSGLRWKRECQQDLQKCFQGNFKAIAERLERSIEARQVREAKDPKSEVERLAAGNEQLDDICRGGLELYNLITGTDEFPLVEQFCQVLVSSSPPAKTAELTQCTSSKE